MAEPTPQNPIRDTNDEARQLARTLTQEARTGALATLAETGEPHVTRVATAWLDGPVTLVSDLSDHTRHMRRDPRASLLLGEPGAKGDPLTHPRITLVGAARFVEEPLRDAWLAIHPKAKLYIDFADFRFVRLEIGVAHLNGGFGKAFRLTPADFGLSG